MTVRDALRDFAPPIVARGLRRMLGGGLRFEGDYPNWEAARGDSGGYNQDAIVRRVLDAELKVKRREAADARDGVTFGSVQFSLPMMAALARAASRKSGSLRVLDLGGAFGGLRRHFRAFGLGGRLEWTVVEQPAFVALGTEHFASDELRFSASLEESLAQPAADIVVLSSVLQYLETPHALASRVAAWGPESIVVDRTPMASGSRDRLTVQRVPPTIYRASYPCWILSRDRLLQAFGARYATVAQFAETSGPWEAGGTPFELAGFLLQREAL